MPVWIGPADKFLIMEVERVCQEGNKILALPVNCPEWEEVMSCNDPLHAQKMFKKFASWLGRGAHGVFFFKFNHSFLEEL